MENSEWHSHDKALPSPQPSKDSQTQFQAGGQFLALQEQGLAGAVWVLQVLQWAGCVPRAAAACKKGLFPPLFSVGAAQVL